MMNRRQRREIIDEMLEKGNIRYRLGPNGMTMMGHGHRLVLTPSEFDYVSDKLVVSYKFVIEDGDFN